MIPRRLFLLSLSSTLPLASCASIPPDSTRRPGGVADSASPPAAPWRPSPSATDAETKSEPAPAGGGRYTCTMHPEIDLPAPGACPKCGMPLVLKKPGGGR